MKPPSRVLISGATGMIGSQLCKHFSARGMQVYALCRRHSENVAKNATCIIWSGKVPPENLPQNIDLVINLAGENIAAERWNETRKRTLTESRVESTRYLIEGLGKLESPPKHFLSASAVGIYGDRDHELLTEASQPGSGFLASLGSAWEASALSLQASGTVVTLMRIAVVLTPKGGALARMLLPFRLGLGGRLGSGSQFMSWITFEDLIRAIDFLAHHRIAGPVNLCAPEACRNLEFTRALAHALKRPAFCAVPRWVLQLLLGQLGEELLLFSTRAYPQRLLEKGFVFSSNEIRSAIGNVLSEKLNSA